MMMPARHTGRPYWDVFLNNSPPLWEARLNLVRDFHFDLFQFVDGLEGDATKVSRELTVIERSPDAWRAKETVHTPYGDLVVIKIYPRAQSPWTEKPILTDPEVETRALLSTLPDPTTFRLAPWYGQMQQQLGESGIIAAVVSVPLAWWLYQRVDLQQGLLDFYDRRTLVERALQVYGEWALQAVEAECRLKPLDLLMFGGSVSSMSVVSPSLYRRYAYPWLCEACRIAASYGVPTAVHMCGRSSQALDMVVDAGVTMVEPLERPPGGDVSLAEVRRRYGSRIVLKGNVNTFETLALGTPQSVLAEALDCIRDAGPLSFILASGDQVPGNTPEENFRAMIDAPRHFVERSP
jgi:hypothetical protein